MPIITAIKQQVPSARNKGGASRVNVYLDYKFGFGIDLDTFVKLKLKVEQELTDAEVEEAKNLADFQKILGKLLNFATLRPRSEKEIKDWFYRKKTPDSYQEGLISKLRKFELLDDEKFARWWIDQRLAYRPKSRRVLESELRFKGIDREVVRDVLSQVSVDEATIARDVLSKRLYRWENLPEREKKKKMTEFLARKGYSWEVIKKV